MNQVLEHIRGKSVQQAQEILPVLARTASALVGKTVRSAAANLFVRLKRPKGLDLVFIQEAWVGHGPMGPMKRLRPAPMGRAHVFKRKVCHLSVVVSDRDAS